VVGDGFGNLRHLVQKVVNRRRSKVEHRDLLNVTTRHLELHPRRRGIKVGCHNLPKRVPSLPHRLLFYLWQLDLLAADRWIVLREATGDSTEKHGKSHHWHHHWLHHSIHCYHFFVFKFVLDHGCDH